jgi:hypothetical protein
VRLSRSSRVTDPASAYRSKGLLIDSNVLLLFFVGLRDRTRIEKFKRTSQFTIEDFKLLVDLIQQFKEVVTTPSILTEVSNLLGQLPEKLRYSFYQHFAYTLRDLRERYTPSGELGDERGFTKFGLTDMAILQAASGKYLVLTDDFRLAQYLEHQNVDVINFNHLRTFN